MVTRLSTLGSAVAISVLIGACAGAPAATPPQAAADGPGFVDKVWRVSESSAVAPGTLYVFLSDGTLVITSANSRPALGTWQFDGGVLTMVEESIAYKVDILDSSAAEFRIRSNNPGGAVEIRLVPARNP